MARCIGLALQGAGRVAPNPMVGAVLVHHDKIIGEGYHQQYGEAHAEVNCLRSVTPEHQPLIPSSTLYVSLEPCAHFGKTPPCADLIIRHRIPEVVIGCRDPFKEVNGKGIEKLQAAGIRVHTGILGLKCLDLNKRFFTFHTLRRPYIILKWAQTKNGLIGHTGSNRLIISGPATNRLVHRWRSEEAGLMVGTNTALLDNPQLTNRLWTGPSPARIAIDKYLQLPASHYLMDGSQRTIVFNTLRHQESEGLTLYQVTEHVRLVQQAMHALYRLNILSVMIEGGAQLTQSFVDEHTWDEARVITNTRLIADQGVKAPELSKAELIKEEMLGDDTIAYYRNPLRR